MRIALFEFIFGSIRMLLYAFALIKQVENYHCEHIAKNTRINYTIFISYAMSG